MVSVWRQAGGNATRNTSIMEIITNTYIPPVGVETMFLNITGIIIDWLFVCGGLGGLCQRGFIFTLDNGLSIKRLQFHKGLVSMLFPETITG